MSDDAAPNAQDLWRMGHRRPWWQWNVVTLFVVLFLLVWVRELFRLSQTATWMICVGALLIWAMTPMMILGPADRRDESPTDAVVEPSDAVDFRLGYMLAACAMLGAVMLTGGMIAALFSMLAALMYAAAVNKS